MDTSEFDTKIGKREEEIKILREEMEKTCNEFLNEANEFTINWFKNAVKEREEGTPEITQKIGEEGLRNLNSELQTLLSKVPDLVDHYLNRDIYWGHRGVIPSESDMRSGRYSIDRDCSIEGPLNEGTQAVLGYVGELFYKYGYFSTGNLKYIKDTWKLNPPSYLGGYEWSDKMFEIMEKYSNQYGKLIKLDDEVKQMKQRKDIAEAKNLMDKAKQPPKP